MSSHYSSKQVNWMQWRQENPTCARVSAERRFTPVHLSTCEHNYRHQHTMFRTQESVGYRLAVPGQSNLGAPSAETETMDREGSPGLGAGRSTAPGAWRSGNPTSSRGLSAPTPAARSHELNRARPPVNTSRCQPTWSKGVGTRWRVLRRSAATGRWRQRQPAVGKKEEGVSRGIFSSICHGASCASSRDVTWFLRDAGEPAQ
jgi:hypothetical protein